MSGQRVLTADLLQNELKFSFSRSSGPGGQNVNKVNTKVTLAFDIPGSAILTEDEKQILQKALRSKLTRDGVLILTAQDKRSQPGNKEAVVLKLEKIFLKALEKRKIRKSTKPRKSAVEKRINKKKMLSEKKKWRQKPF